jgi:NSS family neurotransmitter:Na+ symporter
VICLAAGWLVGQGSVLAFGRAADWHPLRGVPHLDGLNFFGLADFTSANVLMPVSALLVSVFLGWRLGRQIPARELSGLSPTLQRMLLIALRYVCPVGILIVLVAGFSL